MTCARRIVIGSVCAAVLGLLVGAVAESALRARDRRRFPAPGTLIDVGGYRLHVNCTGSGQPVVVLEGGFGVSSNAWALVQPDVARFTTVCSYDRAGYGWSDPPSGPRGLSRNADELHRALSAARMPPPYVLAGHSFGGEVVRVYAVRYPQQIAGLVLIATAHEDWETRMPQSFTRRFKTSNARTMLFYRICNWAARFGILRVAPEHRYTRYVRDHLPPPIADAEIASIMRGALFKALLAEDSAIENVDQLQLAKHFGSIPLIVVSEKWDLTGEVTSEEKEEARVWDELDREMAARSTRGRRIVADRPGHMIPIEQPHLVVEAIRKVVLEVHATQ